MERANLQQTCQNESINQYRKHSSEGVKIIPRSQLIYDDVIGKGAHGKVVRGRYSSAPVAIKILNRDVTSSRGMKEELLREAQVMQRISHPSVVRLFGIVNEPAEKCLVMELALGPLHDLLYSDRSLLQKHRMDPPDQFRQPPSVKGSKYLLSLTLAMLADCASALDFLHSIGVLHRDIKPANVLIFQDFLCKLCDFGLSKVKDEASLTSTTVTGGAKGTPVYMAPELFDDNAKSSKASDVYSFGIMVRLLVSMKLLQTLSDMYTPDERSGYRRATFQPHQSMASGEYCRECWAASLDRQEARGGDRRRFDE